MKKLVLALLVAGLLPFEVQAGMSERDLQVAARTFGFVSGIPKGEIVVAIVHDPADAASKAEADELNGLMGGGLKVAKHNLKPKLVPVSALDFSGTQVAIVTSGLSGSFAPVFAAASAANVMTISTDFACVDSKQCVMGVAAQPAVKIQVSQAASKATGLEFSQALKMMITESE
ncbi:hypothetical protein [Nisaea sp.]|uniref:hypothetical protein n=1 Tax=Nisaea sp. TaxID=2024842 RepID=UPI003B524F3A